MARVVRALNALMADALGVPRDAIASRFALDLYDGVNGSDDEPSKDGIALRFAHYPETRVLDAGALPYGLHTDYLTFTVLRATAPGLQVLTRDATFVDVLATDGPDAPLLVNAADLTELWSNGAWRSAPHRVVPVPGVPAQNATTAVVSSRARDAIAFFSGPRHDALIEPIVAAADRPRYDPVLAGAYLRAKLDPTSVGDAGPSDADGSANGTSDDEVAGNEVGASSCPATDGGAASS
mmetsp:Transcript_9650/g.39370  ORF Transcript_9650/g.39370 Transcript_9650/m.39370 type:complete len:238 (-) Transcript_9650:39-752(-)